MLTSLSECKKAGVPVYAFGCPELAAMHAASLAPPQVVGTRADGWCFTGDAWVARRTYPVMLQVYDEQCDGRRYVVDHGGFFTLNTLHAGQVCPESRSIAAH